MEVRGTIGEHQLCWKWGYAAHKTDAVAQKQWVNENNLGNFGVI